MKSTLKETITIKELTSHEVSLLLEDKRFIKLKQDLISELSKVTGKPEFQIKIDLKKSMKNNR